MNELWAAFRAVLENLIPVVDIPTGWELCYSGCLCTRTCLSLENFRAANVHPQESGCVSMLKSVCNKVVRIY